MVVGQERLPQLGELVVPQLPVHQMAVELLGGVKDGEVCLFLNDLPDEYD